MTAVEPEGVFCCNTDPDCEGEPANEWDAFRGKLDTLSGLIGEWQGIPTPIGDLPVILHDRHPLRGFFNEKADEPDGDPNDAGDGERVVNRWFSRQRNAEVYVVRGVDGRSHAEVFPKSPDHSMDRLTMWLNTMGAHQAWSLDAEYTAREKLCGLLADHQWHQYELTGVFLETSPRSKITYLFRRLRPTIALTPRWPDGKQIDTMRCLAVLCMHPCGYYKGTWAGCLTPSDDVIAHLLMCRADEAGYWKQCNQHDPSSPEAGL